MMRDQLTSIAMTVALGSLVLACEEQPEDPRGVAWVPPGGGDDSTDVDASSGASGWSGGDQDSDPWGSGDDSASDSGSADAGPADPTDDSGAGDDSGGQDPGGDDDSGADAESPYAGGWDVGACDNASGAGDAIVGTDQHGDSVYLRDFCHKSILFVLGNFT